MRRIATLLLLLLTVRAGYGQDNWMQEKLKELSKLASDSEVADEWSIEEGGTYVINGSSWRASMPSLDTIVLKRIQPPPPPPPVNRVINQFQTSRPEILLAAQKYGIPPSTIVGWGLVTSLNSGLCGGDGWEDQIGREKALVLSRAGHNRTRWEYGLYGADGQPDAEGGLWGRIVSWGWENPAEYDGWLVFDVETWNMTLMARKPGAREQGRGFVWERDKDRVTLYASYWPTVSDVAAKLAVHPYGVDTNGDGIKDALRFTRGDVIKEHIRIMRMLRGVFPNAKFGAYNFPNMGYWWSDEDETRNMASWEDGIKRLADAGVLDALMPSVYDHYSHLFRFPHMDDRQWERAQELTRARDLERFGRGVRHTLNMGDRLNLPVYLYTWDVFHNDGRCDKAGWAISWGEWEDHIRSLAALRSDRDTPVEGLILWGARSYYWEKVSCYRANMETYIGTTQQEFDRYDQARAMQILRRASAIARDTWGN